MISFFNVRYMFGSAVTKVRDMRTDQNVIKLIFSKFIIFLSKISLCKVTKFLYWRLDN
jgi:hypothetical protein